MEKDEEKSKYDTQLKERLRSCNAELTLVKAQLEQAIHERERVEAEQELLLAAERQRADELEALRTTMTDITAELELESLLQAIVIRAASLLTATGGELGLFEKATQVVRVVVSHNLGEGYVGARHSLGDGAMGKVAETHEPLIIQDYLDWEARAPFYADVQIHASMAAPLMVGSRFVGVITIASTDLSRQFNSADLHLLQLFAQQAAIAIENARLFGETQRRAVEMATLTEVGKALSSTLRIDDLVQLIYEQTRRVMYAEDMLIELYNEADHELICVFSTNPDEISVGARVSADLGFASYVIKLRKSLLLKSDLSQHANEMGVIPLGGAHAETWLGVPMLRAENVLGLIIVQHYKIPNIYDETHQVLLEIIASQAAIAFENARLFDQAQREISERQRVEAELISYQEHLEERVAERTADLKASENRYRSLFDGIPVGLYRTTPTGQFLDANLAFAQMLGYANREDLLSINAGSSYVDPEDRIRWQDLMEREGIIRDFEFRDRRVDGAVIWVSDSARSVRDEQGQVLYYEGSLEDITQRKHAEEELRRYREHLEELVEERTSELRESEERYRTLFDDVPVGLYRATPSGKLLDINLAAVQMNGYSSREMALAELNTSSVYLDPETRVEWQTRIEQEGVVRDFEFQLHRRDGSVIWVSDTARTVNDEKGQVLYYEGSIEDISERKRVEEELRRQMEYFRALFVGNPVAALTADLQAKVVSWNPMAEKLFGYRQEEAIGQHVDDLVAKDPVIRGEALKYTNQVLTEGGVQAVSKRTHKNGTLLDVEILGLPVIVGGELVGYIAIYHDIGELQIARRKAEAANQAKSTFLANMSHELRTPLNAILGFTQIMESDPNLTSDQQENLRIINASGEHLLALINDVLEMSKIEAGQVAYQEKSFDLFRLLEILEETFQLRAEEKGLILSVKRTETVPQFICTDEGKLRQVLVNLIGNAIKFTEEGIVALRVSTAVEEQRLIIEIEDTGLGIPPEEIDSVFEPFVQTESGQKSVEGTGLGLSISRKFARLMGGDLSVSSELGQGSIFRLDFPFKLADATGIMIQPSSRKVIGIEPTEICYRILIVDDRRETRLLLSKLLQPLGFDLRQAANGLEAIELCESWEPDLIWMDMRMPVMDGYEATHQIKASTPGRETIIVALTASAFEEDLEAIFDAGCDDVVRKPFRKEEIFEKISLHLGVRFIYAEDSAQPTQSSHGDLVDILNPATIASLPPDWLSELHQATTKANMDMILNLIDQIRHQNESLADALEGLAQNFEYKKILNAIDQIGEAR